MLPTPGINKSCVSVCFPICLQWKTPLSPTDSIMFVDDESDLKLKIRVDYREGHDIVSITNRPSGEHKPESLCNYTVRYHVEDPTSTDIIYHTDSLPAGTGECYSP